MLVPEYTAFARHGQPPWSFEILILSPASPQSRGLLVTVNRVTWHMVKLESEPPVLILSPPQCDSRIFRLFKAEALYQDVTFYLPLGQNRQPGWAGALPPMLLINMIILPCSSVGSADSLLTWLFLKGVGYYYFFKFLVKLGLVVYALIPAQAGRFLGVQG